MKVNNQSKDHKDYLDFVVKGLEKYDKAQKHIEEIDVYHSSLSVTYKTNHSNITELLKIHNHIKGHGLDPFFSIADMKNGQTVTYKLDI